jgi:hypothetical protein
VRIESFGHGGLKHSFSQVERDLDIQEISKLISPSQKDSNKEEGGYSYNERRR